MLEGLGMDIARCLQEAKLLREANVAVRARPQRSDIGLSGTGMAPAVAPQTVWSKFTTAPVISPASSETIKLTARAASAGSMRRPQGRAATALASQSGSPVSAACNSRSWSEAIQPTLSWLTRIRFLITEKAVFRVSVASAPFVAQ